MKKCKYAWTHFDFKPGGYAPCFRFKLSKYGHGFGAVPDKPSDVVNSDEWQRMREQLRNDEWPDECHDCRIQEENGIKSYRERSLDDPFVSDPDYSTNKVVIKDLQLKMSRACNYFCRHCGTASNSQFLKVGRQNPKIAQTLFNKHSFNHLGSPIGDIPHEARNEIDIPTPEVIDDLFENVLPTVERIEFAGGEPFYHAEMYKFLQRMIDDSTIDTSKIQLQYNTNMSMTKFKKFDIIELWEHFQAVHLTVSMDGTGNVFNYFRQGGNYDQVVANIHDMLERSSKINSILLVCTTCAYHAFYMNEIDNDLFHLGQELERLYGIKIHRRTTFVHWPKGLDVVNLAEETKQKLYEEANDTEFLREYRLRLKGKRTIPEETFKEIVMLQDQAYNRDASELAPKIFDYVY